MELGPGYRKRGGASIAPCPETSSLGSSIADGGGSVGGRGGGRGCGSRAGGIASLRDLEWSPKSSSYGLNMPTNIGATFAGSSSESTTLISSSLSCSSGCAWSGAWSAGVVSCWSCCPGVGPLCPCCPDVSPLSTRATARRAFLFVLERAF